MHGDQSSSLIRGFNAFPDRSRYNPMHPGSFLGPSGIPRPVSDDHETEKRISARPFPIASPRGCGKKGSNSAAEKVRLTIGQFRQSANGGSFLRARSGLTSFQLSDRIPPPGPFGTENSSASNVWIHRSNPFDVPQGKMQKRKNQALSNRQNLEKGLLRRGVQHPGNENQPVQRKDFGISSILRKRSRSSHSAPKKRLQAASDLVDQKKPERSWSVVGLVPDIALCMEAEGPNLAESRTTTAISDIIRRVQDKLQDIPTIVSNSLACLTSKRAELEKELQAVTNRSLSLSNELEVVRHEKSTHLREISDMREGLVILEMKYKKCQQALQEQCSDADNLRSKFQEFAAECESCKEKMKKLQTVLHEKTRTHAEVRSKLQESQEEFRYLQAEMEKQRDQHKHLSSLKEKLEKRVRTAEKRLTEKIKEYEAQCENLKKSVETLQLENDELNGGAKVYQVQRNLHVAKIEGLEKELCEGRARIERERSERLRILEQLRKAEVELSIRKKKNSLFVEEENLLKKNDGIRCECDARLLEASKDIQSMDQKLFEREEEVNTQKEKNTRLGTELQLKKNEVENLEEANEKLRKDHSQHLEALKERKRTNHKENQDLLASIRHENESIKAAHLKNIKEGFSQMKDAKNTYEKKIEGMSREVEQTNAKLDNLKQANEANALKISVLQNEAKQYGEVHNALNECLRRVKQLEVEKRSLLGEVQGWKDKLASSTECGQLKDSEQVNLSPTPLKLLGSGPVSSSHSSEYVEGISVRNDVGTFKEIQRNPSTEKLGASETQEVESTVRRPLRPRNGPIAKLQCRSKAKAKSSRRGSGSKRAGRNSTSVGQEKGEDYEDLFNGGNIFESSRT